MKGRSWKQCVRIPAPHNLLSDFRCAPFPFSGRLADTPDIIRYTKTGWNILFIIWLIRIINVIYQDMILNMHHDFPEKPVKRLPWKTVVETAAWFVFSFGDFSRFWVYSGIADPDVRIRRNALESRYQVFPLNGYTIRIFPNVPPWIYLFISVIPFSTRVYACILSSCG